MGVPSTQTSCATSCRISLISCGDKMWIQQYVYCDAEYLELVLEKSAVLADLDGDLHSLLFSMPCLSSLSALSFLPFLDLCADS